MAECVDLTSDTDEPFQCQTGRGGQASTAGEAINLLSSEDELSPAAQRARLPYQAQPVQSTAATSLQGSELGLARRLVVGPSSGAALEEQPAERPKSPLSELGLGLQHTAEAHAVLGDEAVGGRPCLKLSARKLKPMYTDDAEVQDKDEMLEDLGIDAEWVAEATARVSRPQKGQQQARSTATANIFSQDSSLRHGADNDRDWEVDESPQPKRKKGGRLTAEERAEAKAAKEREKQLKQQQKAEERQAKKKEKEERLAAEKAQKAQQRLDRKRATGKTALQDITIHLDPELARHRTGREIMAKLEETYGQPSEGGCGVELSQRLAMWPNRSTMWSRKVYGPEVEEEEPMPSQLSQRDPGADWRQKGIPYVLVCLTAEEFVTEVLKDELQSLVERAARVCPDCTLALLVEGLEHHLIQRERREYKANGPGGGGFNRAVVDSIEGKLAVQWPGLRHMMVADVAQAAEHVTGLTRVLAEQPFTAQESYLRSFGCGKPDSAGTNDLLKRHPLSHTDRHTFFSVLNQVPDTGPQIAHAVASNYPSLGALIAAFQAPGSQGEKLLEGLVRPGGSRVGPTNARKLYKIFTCEDPDFCIQEARK